MPKDRIREYYVYDSSLGKELAGHPIIKRGASRLVRMLPVEAQYWVDQGAIGVRSSPPKLTPAPLKRKKG